jgi:hypothetical protein
VADLCKYGAIHGKGFLLPVVCDGCRADAAEAEAEVRRLRATIAALVDLVADMEADR